MVRIMARQYDFKALWVDSRRRSDTHLAKTYRCKAEEFWLNYANSRFCLLPPSLIYVIEVVEKLLQPKSGLGNFKRLPSEVLMAFISHNHIPIQLVLRWGVQRSPA